MVRRIVRRSWGGSPPNASSPAVRACSRSPRVADGLVALVGAGPGDVGLLTVRGAELLGRAEVVVYDRLAAPELLAHAPDSAERIYVGKSPGEQALTQDQINALLVERGQRGELVVRLKGGDPFVFG